MNNNGLRGYLTTRNGAILAGTVPNAPMRNAREAVTPSLDALALNRAMSRPREGGEMSQETGVSPDQTVTVTSIVFGS